MAAPTVIKFESRVLDIDANWGVSSRETRPGPPERVDGMTLGIVSMDSDAPHGGEVHPDGDEILYVISGKLRVTCDGEPPVTLDPGQACIVPKGVWHLVDVLEPTQLMHLTPGPNGDHRPL